jgi:hypothetical protein
MSTIKPYKESKCKSCLEMEVPDDSIKKTISGNCFEKPHFHYQKTQSAKYIAKSAENKKRKSAAASKGSGLTLGKWFNEQINQVPRNCENCNEYLNPYAPWTARAYIAHIVPKRYFTSVMLHPMNRVFLCIDCHTKFDNSLSREIIQMKVWPVAVSRFFLFLTDIDKEEIKHLAPCFEAVIREND